HLLFNVFCGDTMMQMQPWKKIAAIALLASALLLVSWWIGRRPYITAGSHKVFRMDSNAGAMAGVFGFIILLPATIAGLVSLWFCIADRNFQGDAARVGKVCTWIVTPYIAVLMLVSLLTPRTIVSIGDGYCWDLWCLGVEQVNATPQGQNIIYTARVRLFSDA